MDLHDLRQQYTQAGLHERDLAPDPFQQFERWFKDAVEANQGQWFEPNAMTLATVDDRGQPDARIVLLKSFDNAGFVFYTNTASRKGRQLHANPHAALVFHWASLERQVRIQGRCQPLGHADAQAYFARRPRGSQLGAAASRQSAVVPSRDALEAQLAHLDKLHANAENIPMPEDWGGYRLIPHAVEFWQGRENRLHDRLEYLKPDPDPDPPSPSQWIIQRLSP